MRAKSAGIQGALAVVALGAAYATWQRAPERAVGDVEVLALKRGDLEKVRFEDGARWVELTRGPGAPGPKVWLRVGASPVPPAPSVGDGGRAADGGAAAQVAAAAPTPERELRGSEAADRDWEAFAPLMASRALGKLGDAKLKELGLVGSARHLEVRGRGVDARFTVAPSVAGLGAPYIRSETDGTVYLLGGTLLADLDSAATRLVERQLHGFRPEEVDGFSVTAGGASRRYRIHAAASGALTVLGGDGEKPDVFAKNWHEKLLRLWPAEILGRGEQPLQGTPQLAFRVDYQLRGGEPAFLEVASAGRELFARSERSAGWVRLPPNSEDLVLESKRMVGAP